MEMTKVEKLIAAGGKRWQKNGYDRIYLSRAIRLEITDDMSRKCRNDVYATKQDIYYDVVADKYVWHKTGRSFLDEAIENEIKRLEA